MFPTSFKDKRDIYNGDFIILVIEFNLLVPILGIIGFAIGFVDGMVGLLLGVLRFPLIIGVETSIGVASRN